MKKFELNLSKYEVMVKEPVTEIDEKSGKEVRKLKDKLIEYPLRDNLSGWLRTGGIFKTGEDIAEAVSLARTIRQCNDDVILLDEREAGILKKCLNKFIELTAEDKANLGGEIHEEAICRIFGMKEVK